MQVRGRKCGRAPVRTHQRSQLIGQSTARAKSGRGGPGPIRLQNSARRRNGKIRQGNISRGFQVLLFPVPWLVDSYARKRSASDNCVISLRARRCYLEADWSISRAKITRAKASHHHPSPEIPAKSNIPISHGFPNLYGRNKINMI